MAGDKCSLTFVISFFVLFFLPLLIVSSSKNATSVEESFRNFIIRYNRTYLYDVDEYNQRLAIFKANLKRIEELNNISQKQDSELYGITKFTDLSPEEFQEQYLSSLNQNYGNSININILGADNPTHSAGKPTHSKPVKLGTGLPQKVDWRKKGKVTEVKNQKSCGGCWAFSTVEAVESSYAIKYNELRSLSPQEVIDCSYQYHKYLQGCKGGDTWIALDWMVQNKVPLVGEKKYPLTDTQQACDLQFNHTQGITLTKYSRYRFLLKEQQMLAELVKRPLVVSVDAHNWNNYLGGIIQYHCGTAVNHAVIVVGYDLTGPVPYYIVKNSWGEDFGHFGYIYIKAGSNVCGIASEVAAVDELGVVNAKEKKHTE